MYVYNEYWDSEKAILLYPSQINEEIYDKEKNIFIGKKHSCSIGKVSIFNDEKLNINLGIKILELIK